MHLLRLDALRRFLAATLVVALGLSVVPTASAYGATPSLSSMLDDAEAFETALAAAHAAAPGDDPLAVFAETYAASVDGVSADALAHLLGRSSLTGILPPVHDDALATSKVQVPPTVASAVVWLGTTPAPTAGLTEASATRVETAPLRIKAPSARPRAP